MKKRNPNQPTAKEKAEAQHAELLAKHQQWITDSYKHERLGGRGAEYEAAIREYRRKDFIKDGYDLISRHESKTGEAVYFPDEETALRLLHESCRR
jgi:hypothetical protein